MCHLLGAGTEPSCAALLGRASLPASAIPPGTATAAGRCLVYFHSSASLTCLGT